jgi:hypothetical protein
VVHKRSVAFLLEGVTERWSRCARVKVLAHIDHARFCMGERGPHKIYSYITYYMLQLRYWGTRSRLFLKGFCAKPPMFTDRGIPSFDKIPLYFCAYFEDILFVGTREIYRLTSSWMLEISENNTNPIRHNTVSWAIHVV